MPGRTRLAAARTIAEAFLPIETSATTLATRTFLSVAAIRDAFAEAKLTDVTAHDAAVSLLEDAAALMAQAERKWRQAHAPLIALAREHGVMPGFGDCDGDNVLFGELRAVG